jgi:hypothetical protein
MKPPDHPCKTDFTEVMKLFLQRGIVPPNPPPKLMETAKVIHRYTYGLILWRFRLGELPPHSAAFLDELSSDALQILPQTLMGYDKTTSLLIRGVLENALRHVYFSDHPVEFARLNRDRKWYVGMDSLFEYARNHFDFVVTEPKFDCVSQISSLYSSMSETVHGRTVHNLELREALAQIAFDQELATRHAANVVKCAQAVGFLLAIFHRKALRTFSSNDRSFLLRSMPTEARQIWTEHE